MAQGGDEVATSLSIWDNHIKNLRLLWRHFDVAIKEPDTAKEKFGVAREAVRLLWEKYSRLPTGGSEVGW